jgi:hypothetical protein
MNAKERLLYAGYENIKYLENYSYDNALVGVTEDGRAVYNYELMIDWLINKEGWTDNKAVEWIEHNVVRVLSHMGNDAPIIVYPLPYY